MLRGVQVVDSLDCDIKFLNTDLITSFFLTTKPEPDGFKNQHFAKRLICLLEGTEK